ncbi:HNH endonuclease family protein [Candidatus Pelagibacter sp.]|uniref:HNH endonuclease family protein n=1 Tax=Candidatus Pelagibacter sp. TaxID=2024849 RepID=UPI003F855229|tara:strand:+ start:1396 stop:2520 length:1125 start_codon:yes stop_codon:yes gene_type:complete
MNIDEKKITIKELTQDYIDNGEGGVFGYGGKLNIRPPYQREFIYDEEQRNAVIKTVNNGFPLNTMYWAVLNDGNFEIIDGQQRTISLCRYVNSEFSYNDKYFHNLQDDEKDNFLNYNVMVYLCSGSDSEKLEWFKTINIAGEELTDQELRNAVYHGPWVSNAKKYFSKTGCPASDIGGDYLNGSSIRQDFLETVIKWKSDNKISEYMAKNQNESSAEDLWKYFQNVIEWVEKTFKNKRKFMKGLPWGTFYNKYKNEKFNPDQVEDVIIKLIKFEDQIKLKGIYQYILTGQPKYIYDRKFPDNIKNKVYEKQNRKCKICNEHFEISEMEADHIKAWFDNGETTEKNCQMICRPHHYEKTAEQTRVLRKKFSLGQS